MKITKIELYKMDLPIKYPIKTAVGVVASNVENVLVKIFTDSDIYGLGEASPFPPITGDTQGSNLSVGQDLAKLILNKNPLEIEERMKEINQFIAGEPSIRSAFDMALYDILGKAANMPVFRLLGGANRKLITDCTIGWQETVEKTVDRAKELVQQGFNELKFKTGRSGMIDIDHIKAVREAVGPNILIKIDSNQGWNVAQTISNAIALEPYNLRYIEQPIPVWDFQGFREIRSKIKTPLCADESVFIDKDAFKLCANEAVDFLNIKLGKAGGIHMGLKINAIAESYGAKCMIGCFSETRLGLTAAAHLALARPNIVFLDLDSALFNDADPIINGMQYGKEVKRFIEVPELPGLGVDIEEEYIKTLKKIIIE
ncbi:MAG: mandelate racemase/muconate lactonizing enzyme family protein [Promethearchaeota archaeon]